MWVWVNSGSWRWTGRPVVLQFMGSQRVGHDWATELNWSVHVQSCHLLFDHFQFALIHGPSIPGSYAILLFTALDFTSITSHIHNWVLFLLWFLLFILSGVISPLISSSILGTYQPGKFIFQCPIFLPFHAVRGILKARILKWFAIPFSTTYWHKHTKILIITHNLPQHAHTQSHSYMYTHLSDVHTHAHVICALIGTPHKCPALMVLMPALASGRPHLHWRLRSRVGEEFEPGWTVQWFHLWLSISPRVWSGLWVDIRVQWSSRGRHTVSLPLVLRLPLINTWPPQVTTLSVPLSPHLPNRMVKAPVRRAWNLLRAYARFPIAPGAWWSASHPSLCLAPAAGPHELGGSNQKWYMETSPQQWSPASFSRWPQCPGCWKLQSMCRPPSCWGDCLGAFRPWWPPPPSLCTQTGNLLYCGWPKKLIPWPGSLHIHIPRPWDRQSTGDPPGRTQGGEWWDLEVGRPFHWEKGPILAVCTAWEGRWEGPRQCQSHPCVLRDRSYWTVQGRGLNEGDQPTFKLTQSVSGKPAAP